MKHRIVFLGSKPIGYRCLEYLLLHAAQLQVEVIAVRTQHRPEFEGENDLTALAANYQIPLLNSLDALPECDWIYSVQHHELLKAEHIAKAKKMAVNLHLAPLPEYRGCNQFSFAIIDDAKTFGVTLHEIDTRIDHGSILFETRFEIPENCWVQDLYEMTERHALSLFQETLAALFNESFTPKKQADLLQDRSSTLHYRNEIQNLKNIDLNQSAEQISRLVRALSMSGFEPPYCMINDEKIYFTKK